MEPEDLAEIAKICMEKTCLLSPTRSTQSLLTRDSTVRSLHSGNEGTYRSDQRFLKKSLRDDRMASRICMCAGAHPEADVKKIHQFAIMCAPTTSQYAAVEALKNGDKDVTEMREAYDQRRRYLVKALRDMGFDCYEPQGAFYVFPSIKKFGMTSDEFALKLLEEEKVAVVRVPHSATAEKGYLRISYAYSLNDLKRALERMERFVKRHLNDAK